MKTFYSEGSPFFKETETYLQYRREGYPIIHKHDYWECFILLDGTALHSTAVGAKNITKGHVSILHPENEHFIISQDSKYAELTFSVTDRVFQTLCNCVNDQLYKQIISRNEPIDFYLKLNTYAIIAQKAELYLSLDPKKKKELSSIIKLLWLNILENVYLEHLQQNTNYPDWLNQFIAEIKKPENIALNITKIYKLSNFSHSHLTRLFKQYTGKTLISYFKELKLTYACMLLTTTNQTTLSISGIVGYSSLSTFNKNFKDFYGITPTEFRKNSNIQGV